MPISFKSTLSSAVANATWVDKTQDDATIGKLSLNKPAASGDLIDDPQLQINRNTSVTSDLLLLDTEQVPLVDNKGEQVFTVEGDGGAVTLNSLPFDFIGLSNDVDIVLIGKSDANTVTINHNDTTEGVILNGDATLERFFQLKLKYIGSLERFVEISRNF